MRHELAMEAMADLVAKAPCKTVQAPKRANS
jgi:hypothetical protein